MPERKNPTSQTTISPSDAHKKSARQIADLIRKSELHLGVRLAYAINQAAIYEEERKLNGALGTKASRKKAVKAKMYRDAYRTYATNIEERKKKLEEMVNSMLFVYKPEKRKVWILYFMQNMTVAEIAETQKCPERTIKRWIAEMKKDLEENYNE